VIRYRFLLVGLAAAVSLVWAGTAAAAYDSPRILVFGPNTLGSAGEVEITVAQTRTDDATFRLTIYVPQGYGFTLGPATGTQVGTVVAHAQANAISPDAVIELTGTIQAQPYAATTFPQGAACAGTPAIQTVFVLVLTAAGQTLQVPLYATPAEGPETAFAQAKLIGCLPSPYVPPEQGGATFGAKLMDATLTFRTGFTSPAESTSYRWRALFTPYTVGTATPNPAGTVETQSLDLPGTALTMTATVNRRTRRVTFAGRLGNATDFFTRFRVQVRQGSRVIASGLTNSQGRYRFQSRVLRPGRYTFAARATVGTLEEQCENPINPAVRCLTATIQGFTIQSRPRVVTIRRSGR
jgi:hypothetical protein